MRVPLPARVPLSTRGLELALAVEGEGAREDRREGHVPGGGRGHGEGAAVDLHVTRAGDARGGAQGHVPERAQAGALRERDGAVGAEAAVGRDVQHAGLDREGAVVVEGRVDAGEAVGALRERARVDEGAGTADAGVGDDLEVPALTSEPGASRVISTAVGPQVASGALLDAQDVAAGEAPGCRPRPRRCAARPPGRDRGRGGAGEDAAAQVEQAGHGARADAAEGAAVDEEAFELALAVEGEGAREDRREGHVPGRARGHGEDAALDLHVTRAGDARGGAQGDVPERAQAGARRERDGAVGAEAAVGRDVQHAGLDRSGAVVVEGRVDAGEAVGALRERARVDEGAGTADAGVGGDLEGAGVDERAGRLEGDLDRGGSPGRERALLDAQDVAAGEGQAAARAGADAQLGARADRGRGGAGEHAAAQVEQAGHRARADAAEGAAVDEEVGERRRRPDPRARGWR